MAAHNMSLYESYSYYLNQGDPRVESWPMMDTPFKTLGFLIAYWVSLVAIKRVMRDKKPFDLKSFLILYNFVQVLGSFYIFVELFTVAYLSKYSLVCQAVDYSDHHLAMRMINVLWYYYMSKLVDFIDTIVFALRKKDNQITVLHVFHHSTMFPYGWIGIKYVGGGQTFFLCMLNSFVHTVMYSYYGLAALGPHMQKYLWWKKYLTQLQLIQFFAVMIHSTVNIFAPNCSFPKWFSVSYLVYGMIITMFFLQFYFSSYKTKNETSKRQANGVRQHSSANNAAIKKRE